MAERFLCVDPLLNRYSQYTEKFRQIRLLGRKQIYWRKKTNAAAEMVFGTKRCQIIQWGTFLLSYLKFTKIKGLNTFAVENKLIRFSSSFKQKALK